MSKPSKKSSTDLSHYEVKELADVPAAFHQIESIARRNVEAGASQPSYDDWRAVQIMIAGIKRELLDK